MPLYETRLWECRQLWKKVGQICLNWSEYGRKRNWGDTGEKNVSIHISKLQWPRWVSGSTAALKGPALFLVFVLGFWFCFLVCGFFVFFFHSHLDWHTYHPWLSQKLPLLVWSFSEPNTSLLKVTILQPPFLGFPWMNRGCGGGITFLFQKLG